jgi:hypothetical protein
MNAPDLTESVWQRAKADAEGVYRTATFGVVLAIMELLAVPAAVLATVGHNDTTTQVAVPVLTGAVAMLLAFAAVLVFQLGAAPVRQRNELRQRWSRSEPEPVQPVNIELTLRNERRRGGDILSTVASGVSHSTGDELAAEEWTSGVIDFLSEHVDEDAAREFIEASRNIDGFGRQLQARVQVLDRIIKRVGR